MKAMKNLKGIKTTLLQTALIATISFGALSFSYGQKTKDKKSDDKEKNEAKYSKADKEMDSKFLANVAGINFEEMKLGQLAQQKSKMADVKKLGKMMESSHTKCMNDLKILAKKKNIKIPTALTDNGKEAYKKLNKLSGTEFDKEYCDMMVTGHKGAIEEFENEIKDSKDADIAKFAKSTLKELNSHLEHAEACQKKCEKKE